VKFWFCFLWAIDAVIAAVALYFFFSLAAGGRVGSFNILPWLAILGVLTAVGGSLWLRSAGQHALAIILLLLLAIPGALFVLNHIIGRVGPARPKHLGWRNTPFHHAGCDSRDDRHRCVI
jgi:hypothetical protein